MKTDGAPTTGAEDDVVTFDATGEQEIADLFGGADDADQEQEQEREVEAEAEPERVTQLVAVADASTGDYLVPFAVDVALRVNVYHSEELVERPRAVPEENGLAKYPLSMAKGNRRGIALVFLSQLARNLEPYLASTKPVLVPSGEIHRLSQLAVSSVGKAAATTLGQLVVTLKRFLEPTDSRTWLSEAFSVRVDMQTTEEMVEIVAGLDSIAVPKPQVVITVDVNHNLLTGESDKLKLERVLRSVHLANNKAQVNVFYPSQQLLQSSLAGDQVVQELFGFINEHQVTFEDQYVKVAGF